MNVPQFERWRLLRKRCVFAFIALLLAWGRQA